MKISTPWCADSHHIFLDTHRTPAKEPKAAMDVAMRSIVNVVKGRAAIISVVSHFVLLGPKNFFP